MIPWMDSDIDGVGGFACLFNASLLLGLMGLS
jgi:hypothetical protein